jgi:hemolysin activation/secretion protein
MSQVKWAARAYFSAALPDRGQFFALGGGQLFRGYDLAQRQGSMLWVGNLEARWPVFRHACWDGCDHLGRVENVSIATFYDVGAVYDNGHTVGGNVAHAVGVGLRADIAFFSFIERIMFRFDVAKTVSDNTGLQFWVGFQQPF